VIAKIKHEEENRMNKLTLTALGLGAAYLMRNKGARGKLMKQFESMTGMSNGASNKNETRAW